MVVDHVDKKVWEMLADMPIVSKAVGITCAVLNLLPREAQLNKMEILDFCGSQAEEWRILGGWRDWGDTQSKIGEEDNGG